MYLPNPPWIDRTLSEAWPTIRASDLGVPLIASTGKRLHFDVLGCGHYGCVLPTDKPGVVLKVTSDPTEASFVSVLLTKYPQYPPDGLVRYYGMKRLPEPYRGRTTFAIWREEAYDVGKAANAFNRRLMEFKRMAGTARDYLKKSRDPWSLLQRAEDVRGRIADHVGFGRTAAWGDYDSKGNRRFILGDGEEVGVVLPDWMRGAEYKVAANLRGAEVSAEMMANEPEGYLVGGALDMLLSDGILLADVHTGNIGRVDREDHQGAIVITDPGHAVFLRRELQDQADHFLGRDEEALVLRSRQDAALRMIALTKSSNRSDYGSIGHRFIETLVRRGLVVAEPYMREPYAPDEGYYRLTHLGEARLRALER